MSEKKLARRVLRRVSGQGRRVGQAGAPHTFRWREGMSETVAVRMSVRQDDRVECFVMGLSEAGDYTFRERFADIGEAATFAVKKALEHKVELRVYEVRGKK